MGESISGLLWSSSSRRRPWQLSAAIAMGLLCGVLPKANLTFGLLACASVLLPIHLPLMVATCLLCSLGSSSLAPWAGQLGRWSLTHPLLREVWLQVNSLPAMPWFRLHNTVLHGSLLMGLGAWLPVFWLVRPVMRRWSQYRIACSVLSSEAPLAADPDFRQEIKPAYSEPWQPQRGLSVEQVAERASRIVHYVDELLQACEPDLRSTAGAPTPMRRRLESQDPHQFHDNHRMRLNMLTSVNPAPARQAAQRPLSTGEITIAHTSHPTTGVGSITPGSTTHRRPGGEERQQEALRYLLHHLKEFRDKV